MSLDQISIQNKTKDLLGHFDQEAEIEVVERGEVWCVNIESAAAPLLIGRGGQTLQALEHILRLMLAKEAEGFFPVNLDISSYKATREKDITEMARNMAEKVLETGYPEDLPPMNSFERRLVHVALAEIEGVETISEGEEPERRIIIKRRGV